MPQEVRPQIKKLNILLLSLSLLSHDLISFAEPLPAGGTVVSGQATLSQPNPNTLQVNQSTQRAIIDWQSFDVGKGQTVKFETPGASAITLNRVSGSTLSDIQGSISSNGQLWIINPNGILFGSGAQVNTAGLLASTLNISNDNFNSGHYQFASATNALASVVNSGQLTANGGYIALLAPQIGNTGIVSAALGTVAMGAGIEATLTFAGNQLLNIAVPKGTQVPMYDEHGNSVAALTNSGTIAANGGQVLLTSSSVNTLLNTSINLSGIITADTVNEKAGKIILTASGNTIVNNATLSAQGLQSGEMGGEIKVMGQNVALTHSEVNASGSNGGGDIRIGRDARDTKSSEANQTYIDATTAIKADSTSVGNGGFIEASGKHLDLRPGFQISAKAANHGKAGSVLFDPYNVTISNATTNGNFSGGTFTPTGDDSTIDASSIVSLLTGGTSVIINTGSGGTQNGNITLSSALNAGTGLAAGTTLTLDAAGAINLNNTLSTLGNVELKAAGGNITQTAALNIGGTTTASAGTHAIKLDNASNDFHNQAVTLTGGNITLTDANTTGLTLGEVHATGTIRVTSAGSLTQNNAITTTGQSVTLNIAGDFNQSTDGSIIMGSDSDGWGNLTLHAGTGTGIGTGAINMAGNTEGNILCIDSGSDSTGNLTQSGTWTSHDTNTDPDGIAAMSILNFGTGDIVQTSTGRIILKYPNARKIGIALTAFHSNIIQSGMIDAQQSLVTLKSEFGNHITQDDGAGHLGSITSGMTTILGQNGADANLSGQNSLGLLVDSNGGNLTVNDINPNGLALDTIAIDGNLSITAQSLSEPDEPLDFGIQMSGTGKTATFTVASGNTVGLNHTGFGNDFGGNTVNIVGAEGSRVGAVNIVDTNSTVGLVLGNINADSLSAATQGNISQSGSLNVSGATNLNAGSHDVTLTNDNNLFSGAVSLTGNNVSLTQAAGNNLTLENIVANKSVTVNNTGGTLIFAGNTPTITLDNAANNQTVTLISNQFVNQNTASDSPIDLGSGSGNVWHFYLTNASGNTFGNLASGNPDIFGVAYPTSITETGNRYIFATPAIPPTPVTPTTALIPAINPTVVANHVTNLLPTSNNHNGSDTSSFTDCTQGGPGCSLIESIATHAVA